ncbi:MAG: hypothetical protein JRH14_17065 [Deltaproteobacteria bacterium]|nr:hypothetical protein [Deltaproteobacteria bacterium]MBW2161650.1 hypothetical protein [Deltaproteobacteria bacterium]
MHDEGRAYARKLEAAGVPRRLRELDRELHGDSGRLVGSLHRDPLDSIEPPVSCFLHEHGANAVARDRRVLPVLAEPVSFDALDDDVVIEDAVLPDVDLPRELPDRRWNLMLLDVPDREVRCVEDVRRVAALQSIVVGGDPARGVVDRLGGSA